MDETYIKVSGQWKHLYRAVDRAGDTVDFVLTVKRDRAASPEFVNDFETPRFINLVCNWMVFCSGRSPFSVG